FKESPKAGSIVGYTTMKAVAAAITKAGSANAEPIVDALAGLTIDSPVGPVTFRASDHQATMGTYVGTTTVKDGRGTMKDWHYADGANYLPPDDV
ncbi:ABC transporter substrate-binding protein, partial [Bacillus toyonensis]